MRLSLIGDIMLGRFVATKYNSQKYNVVDENIIKLHKDSDYVFANLESVLLKKNVSNEGHLRFIGNEELLEEFSGFIDGFSLSNNHINDAGELGMSETIEILDSKNFDHNGLFYDTKYSPLYINKPDSKIAIITCTDMMNHEFTKDNKYNTLRIHDLELEKTILDCKMKGYFVILYPHVGLLFSRYPNPLIREFCHKMIDIGVDVIATVHSHVLGGYEIYNNKLIVYSLGDFVMDGSSFRRRQSCNLILNIDNNQLTSWNIEFANINLDLKTELVTNFQKKKLKKSFEKVNKNIIKHSDDYISFFKKQYKKEILLHSLSTLNFILKTKGFLGLLKLLIIRIFEVKSIFLRLIQDRSGMSYDEGAASEKHKLYNNDIK